MEKYAISLKYVNSFSKNNQLIRLEKKLQKLLTGD